MVRIIRTDYPTCIIVCDSAGEPVVLSPGERVPSWAEVGDHAAVDVDLAPAEPSVEDGDGEPDDVDGDEPAPAPEVGEGDEVPDAPEPGTPQRRRRDTK